MSCHLIGALTQQGLLRRCRTSCELFPARLPLKTPFLGSIFLNGGSSTSKIHNFDREQCLLAQRQNPDCAADFASRGSSTSAKRAFGCVVQLQFKNVRVPRWSYNVLQSFR
jgi:hypothetical protein